MSYELFKDGQRKFLTASERVQFITHAQKLSAPAKTFCLMVAHTGCLISEAVKIECQHINFEKKCVHIQNSRKQNDGSERQVPLSDAFLDQLKMTQHFYLTENQKTQRLWSWTVRTGYRKIITVMKEAKIEGIHASPIGLRHGFGAYCVEKNIPLNYIQKWMGHSSVHHTCFYLTLLKKTEREIATKLWE